MSAIAVDLLAEADRHGIRLIPTPAGTINASAATAPPAELLAKLKAHRDELLTVLTEAKADEFSERAAIVEFDGEAPREWAEGFARLDCAHAPADVSPARWRRFIDDCGRFLDEWAAKAAALEWGPLDLFGCNKDKPFARIDQAGLLWLLNGHRVAALTRDVAVVEMRSGVRQTYRRRSTQPGRVLAWELGR